MKYIAHGAVLTTLTAVALAAAGTAHADPVAAQSDAGTLSVELAPGVQFSGTPSDNASTLDTPFGTVTLRDGQVSLAAAVQPSPADAVDPTVQPAALVTNPAPVEPVAGANPLSDLGLAWHQAGAYTGLGAAVGGTAGALVGAVVGCPIGAVTLGSMATVMSAAALTVPGMIGGCLAGAGSGAAFGGMIGAAAVGLPVGAAVTIQKYNEIQQKRAAGLPVDVPQQH